jgi:hypothetical protein
MSDEGVQGVLQTVKKIKNCFLSDDVRDGIDDVIDSTTSVIITPSSQENPLIIS